MSRPVDLTPDPVWVTGKGLVSPPGWISPETRALMDKAQRECAEAAESIAARKALPQGDDKGDGTPAGFVIDPTGGKR